MAEETQGRNVSEDDAIRMAKREDERLEKLRNLEERRQRAENKRIERESKKEAKREVQEARRETVRAEHPTYSKIAGKVEPRFEAAKQRIKKEMTYSNIKGKTTAVGRGGYEATRKVLGEIKEERHKTGSFPYGAPKVYAPAANYSIGQPPKGYASNMRKQFQAESRAGYQGSAEREYISSGRYSAQTDFFGETQPKPQREYFASSERKADVDYFGSSHKNGNGKTPKNGKPQVIDYFGSSNKRNNIGLDFIGTRRPKNENIASRKPQMDYFGGLGGLNSSKKQPDLFGIGKKKKNQRYY